MSNLIVPDYYNNRIDVINLTENIKENFKNSIKYEISKDKTTMINFSASHERFIYLSYEQNDIKNGS